MSNEEFLNAFTINVYNSLDECVWFIALNNSTLLV